MKERLFEPPFELLNLLAERRLRDVAPLSGPAEVARLGDRHEIAQLMQFHVAFVDPLPTSPASFQTGSSLAAPESPQSARVSLSPNRPPRRAGPAQSKHRSR